MKRYTLSILAEDLEAARKLCFSVPEVEGACFLLCGRSETEDELRLLCQAVVPVRDEAYLERRADFLSLDSSSYVAAAKEARAKGLSLVFVHSHPGGFLDFSEQDDREEPKLQEFFKARVPDAVHGSLILTEREVIGRVWDGGFQPMAVVRVIGPRFSFHFGDKAGIAFSEYFDRQVKAFGPEIQAVLSKLHIGVVGAGGTGSAAIEQLTRLGVGTLSLFDEDAFAKSNVNRVYGSGVSQAGEHKVEIARKSIERIGVGTTLHVYPRHITHKEVAASLRDCDLVFGCTDKEAPRAILTQLAIRYLIPLIDMGVVISSEDGHIKNVVGRVTTAYPGEACLFCRGRIQPKVIAFEMLPEAEQKLRVAQGYAPELATTAPAVVPFTSTVAATAVTELIHRLTGFMGASRQSTEVLQFFENGRLATNRTPPNPNCICADKELRGLGDADERFLGMWG